MLAVARLQIEAGAQGICCAKTGEAEVFADGGIDDIFIANQVVGAAKMRRLRALAERVRLAVGVDHPDQINLLSQAFRGVDPLDISIEIDVGQRRTGVVEPHEAVELAQRILDSPGLALRGVYTHEGHDYAAQDDADLAVIADQAQRQMLEAAQAIRDATGAPCEVSMGSTPSLFARKFHPGIDELRPGTAVFNDGSHANFLGHSDWCAATVLATVVNLPASDRVVVDAGAKALTSDRRGPEHSRKQRLRHGRWPTGCHHRQPVRRARRALGPRRRAYTIGGVIQIIPNHICPCVNLYDQAFVARGRHRPRHVWEVSARGQSQ